MHVTPTAEFFALPALMIPENKSTLLFCLLEDLDEILVSNGLMSERNSALKCPGGVLRVISAALMNKMSSMRAFSGGQFVRAIMLGGNVSFVRLVLM